MKKLFYLLAFTYLMVFSKTTFASHFAGCDISYACTSTPNIYKVTMKIYRSCSGVNFCSGCTNPIPTGNVTGCTTSSSSFVNSITGATGTFTGINYGSFNLNALPGTGIDIVVTCDNFKTICTNCNTRTPGTYSPGLEVYEFEGNVNLSAIPAACCKVILGTSTCCWNGGITTFNPSSFYTEAILDRCQTICNSAPIFTNNARPIICSGIDFTYNLGAIDPDGDSLSYEFAPSLEAANSNVAYVTPYGINNPFPYLGAPNPNALYPAGLQILPTNGDIRFRPMGVFSTNLAIGVFQWKYLNGVWINVGYTRRDVQMETRPCFSNKASIIKIYKNGIRQFNNNYELVAGQPFCLDLVCEDQQDLTITPPINSDTTELTWNNPGIFDSTMSNATFTANYILSQRGMNGPKADSFKFCWTPPINAIRKTPHFFTVIGNEKLCPIKLGIISGISLKVSPTHIIIDSIITKKTFCNNKITNTNVKYQSRGISLLVNNLFTVQLSDSLGSFTNPSTIGTKTSTDTIGLIVVNIPANLPLNKNYKIRVNCSSDNTLKGIEMSISFVGGFTKPSITSNKDSICNGLTANLQTSHIGAGYVYKWLKNNQFIANATNNNLTINNDSNYRVIVSNTGCTDTSLVKKITILPKPIANIGISTFCASPNAVNIVNSSTIASGTMSYNWTFSDNTTSAILSPSKTFIDSGSITANLVVTSNFNCKDSVIKTIIINSTPKANFNINDTLQCVTGNRFTLLNTTTGGSIYNWNFGDNTTNNNVNNNKVYINAGNYAIKLVASASGCSDSIVKNVNVVAKATNVDFSVNQMSQCLRGNNFVFTNNSNPNNTTLSYLWTFDNFTTSTLRNPANFSTNKVGVVPVSLVVVANEKCIDTISKNITVTANPQIGTILGNVNPNSNATPFTYSVLNQANSTYNWTATNATVQSGQGTNQISVLFTNAGNAKIVAQITDNNNCTDSNSLNLAVTVGINELSLENDLKVFPNPTKSTLTITNKTNMLGKKYIITNLIGQTVLSGKLNLDETVINTESLTKGVYLLSIEGMNKQAIKIIKE